MADEGARSDGAIGIGPWQVPAHLWRAALAVIVAQLVYWFAVVPWLITPPLRPDVYKTAGYSAATLTAPTSGALRDAEFKPIELPWYDCCHGYRAFRFTWTLDRIPPHGIGAIANVDADNTIVLVNGHVLRAFGRMDVANVTHHRLRTLMFVSPGLLTTGENRIDVIMVRAGIPYFDVRSPLVGDYAAMHAAFERRMFIFDEYAMIAASIALVLAIIALVVMLRSDKRALAFWVFALALGWSLLTFFYVWTDPPFRPDVRMIYYFALTNLLPLAWLNLADAWSGRPKRWITLASCAAYGLVMAATAVALLMQPAPGGFDFAGAAADAFGLALSVAAILRFGWHILRHREERAVEFGVFTLCISVIALDRIGEVFGNAVAGHLQMTAPLLLLALVLAYVSSNIRLFRSMTVYNTELTERVAAREQELIQSHARESALLQTRAHEAERQRILRDMHDGIGSQLMSLLLAAKRGALVPDRMVEGLQSVIDELRLLIQSMDSVGESLSSALALFRERIGHALQEAGMELSWRDTLRTPPPAYGPREVLQVFRVLQEAATNAMKHAGARTLAVSVSDGPDAAFPVRIALIDDGAGFRRHEGGGRGLDNMAQRAASIGARLDVRDAPTGVTVVLDLPARSAGPAP